jgi:polo-like kinase 1
VYVSSWVDYSLKFGLGYLLTDENIGFNFNDGSKMITLQPNNQAVKYFDKKKVDEETPD